MDRCPTCGSIGVRLFVPAYPGSSIGTHCHDPWHDQKEKPMNEWKELEIDNLQPDIFSQNADYEVEFLRMHRWYPSSNYISCEYGLLIAMLRSGQKYRYRRKEKPQGPHEARVLYVCSDPGQNELKLSVSQECLNEITELVFDRKGRTEPVFIKVVR